MAITFDLHLSPADDKVTLSFAGLICDRRGIIGQPIKNGNEVVFDLPIESGANVLLPAVDNRSGLRHIRRT